MIERLYLKDLLGFETLELEFSPGLVVFTGPSGAGKSVLMQAILADLGIGQAQARLCEIEIAKPSGLASEAYEMEDRVAIKAIRKERVAYYLDGQKISRKGLKELFAPYVRYLSVRDRGGFESTALLEMLDRSRSVREKSFRKLLREYRKRYTLYRQKQTQLEEILAGERERAERIEFARYEIEKIASIDPKEGEYEELLQIKQRLSRLDKIEEAMERASGIFDLEESVQEVFRLLEREASYFSDAMNQLRADFDAARSLAEDLAEVEIESVLDRLEKLSGLIARYGSIGEALEYKAAKEKELESLEHSERNLDALREYLALEGKELATLAGRISEARREEAGEVEQRLRPYLERLKLPPVALRLEPGELGESGSDRASLEMEGSGAATLSGGEFNRLRLALMSVTMEGNRRGEGVIFLDEIDANVSGDESIAIAEMIAELSRVYQIFAISHQPHLSARADRHILVRKSGGKSVAEVLEEEGRIREIARIVSGESPDEEASAFAGKLRRQSIEATKGKA